MAAAELVVEVVYSPRAGAVESVPLRLAPGATVADALRASGLMSRHAGLEALPVGVWGTLRPVDQALRDGDRVEVYRPLLVDPKQARRVRYRAHLEKFGRRR